MAKNVKGVGSARQAELITKAHAIREEVLGEAGDKMDRTMVVQKLDEARLLEERAAAIVDVDDEARENLSRCTRVGDDKGTRSTRLNGEDDPDGPENRADPDLEGGAIPRSKRRQFARQMKEFTTQVRNEFGSELDFLRGVGGRATNARQQELIDKVRDFTRTITGDPGSAEVLMPLQQAPDIFRAPNEASGIMEDARRYNVIGRSLRIPQVKQTDGGVSRPLAGISAVEIFGEGVTPSKKEIKFTQRELIVSSWKAIAEIADETVEDDYTGEIQPVVSDQISQDIRNEMNMKMTFTGTGVGEPLGAIYTSNPSLMKVPRATAGTVKVADIFKMVVRHMTGPKSRWLVSPYTFEDLLSLQLNDNGPSLVTYIPNLRDGVMVSIPTLMGYPVVITPLANAKGTEGDISLVNPEFYAAGIRREVTAESTQIARYEDFVTTFRLRARAGGIPIPDGFYAFKAVAGVLIEPRSPFVTLTDHV